MTTERHITVIATWITCINFIIWCLCVFVNWLIGEDLTTNNWMIPISISGILNVLALSLTCLAWFNIREKEKKTNVS